MTFTLILVSCLDHAGCSLLIEDEICIIQGPHPKHAILGSVLLVHGLYQMLLSTLVNPPKLHHVNITNSPMSINELHHCLSHLNFHTLQEMVSKGVVTGVMLNSSTADFCSTCIQEKAHHQAFPKESQTTFMVYGEMVIVNLWGPAQVTSLREYHYYHINFLKKKSEAFD